MTGSARSFRLTPGKRFELTSDKTRIITETITDEEKAKIIAEHKKSGGALSLVGIAAKAGKLVGGTDRICDEVRRHGIPGGDAAQNGSALVLISSDASANTEKRIRNACRYYGIRSVKTVFSSEDFGNRAGLGSAAAVAVFDPALVKGISAYFVGQD